MAVSLSSASIPSAAYRFVDIGANLLDPMFLGVYRDKALHAPDLAHVLDRARKAGAASVFVTAGTVEESRNAMRLAREFNAEQSLKPQPWMRLKSTVGIHPTHAAEVGDLVQAQRDLLELAAEGKRDGTCVAIGECGLDRAREHFAPFDIQKKVWEMHFALCESTGLPMFIHSRDCEEDTLDFLGRFPLKKGGVVHSYDGTLETALKICSLNELLFIGVNGCSLRTQANLDVVKEVPLDRLLVESDSPWCEIKNTSAAKALLRDHKWDDPEVNKPERLAGKEGTATVKSRNEPRATLEVLKVISALKGKPVSEVCDVILTNTERLFGSVTE